MSLTKSEKQTIEILKDRVRYLEKQLNDVMSFTDIDTGTTLYTGGREYHLPPDSHIRFRMDGALGAFKKEIQVVRDRDSKEMLHISSTWHGGLKVYPWFANVIKVEVSE